MTRIILDTGPLVAYFNSRDTWHLWAVEQMKALAPPLLTCEPVVTEACFLIHRAGGDAAKLIRALREEGHELSSIAIYGESAGSRRERY